MEVKTALYIHQLIFLFLRILHYQICPGFNTGTRIFSTQKFHCYSNFQISLALQSFPDSCLNNTDPFLLKCRFFSKQSLAFCSPSICIKFVIINSSMNITSSSFTLAIQNFYPISFLIQKFICLTNFFEVIIYCAFTHVTKFFDYLVNCNILILI